MTTEEGHIFLLKQQIVSPMHQRLGICPSCGHKLNFWEKKKAHNRKVICKRCGMVYSDKGHTY